MVTLPVDMEDGPREARTSHTACKLHTRDDGGHEPLPLAAEGGAEALGAADEEPDDEVGVLLHGLAVHPHAEPQEVQEALPLHRVLQPKGSSYSQALSDLVLIFGEGRDPALLH